MMTGYRALEKTGLHELSSRRTFRKGNEVSVPWGDTEARCLGGSPYQKSHLSWPYSRYQARPAVKIMLVPLPFAWTDRILFPGHYRGVKCGEKPTASKGIEVQEQDMSKKVIGYGYKLTEEDLDYALSLYAPGTLHKSHDEVQKQIISDRSQGLISKNAKPKVFKVTVVVEE